MTERKREERKVRRSDGRGLGGGGTEERMVRGRKEENWNEEGVMERNYRRLRGRGKRCSEGRVLDGVRTEGWRGRKGRRKGG